MDCHIIKLQDSHHANLWLLFAEGFRCEAAILRGPATYDPWKVMQPATKRVLGVPQKTQKLASSQLLVVFSTKNLGSRMKNRCSFPAAIRFAFGSPRVTAVPGRVLMGRSCPCAGWSQRSLATVWWSWDLCLQRKSDNSEGSVGRGRTRKKGYWWYCKWKDGFKSMIQLHMIFLSSWIWFCWWCSN